MQNLRITTPPDDKWLTRLRHGHFVWAPKENRFAKVDWAWEPPEPGGVAGRVGICFVLEEGEQWDIEPCQSWYIKPDGTGFDFKPLLMPVEGNCPEEETAISEPWQRQVQRELGFASHRLEQLETAVDTLLYNVLDD